MGASYKGYGTNTLAATGDTALSIIGNAATPRRHWIEALTLMIKGTPADNNSDWIVQRATAEGTATEVVPTRDDVADAEASANVGENHTVEPTYTATEELLELSLNHRASFRWVAVNEKRRLVTPATASAGLGIITEHPSATVDYGVQAEWEE